MNYPKPAPISKLSPAAAASPTYCYVPQYSGMNFVVEGPKKTVLVLDDEEESFGSLLGTGWKRTAMIILIGAVLIVVLPTILRMMKRRR